MKKYLLAAFALLMITACSDQPASEHTSAAALPVYRVLTEHSYPPFIMHTDNGEVSGFEYDLLEAIAANQGFKLHYSAHPWQGLFKTLEENRADIISAGITITDERKKQMDFSDPYFETESVLLANKNTLPTLKGLTNLNGAKVAVKAGTSQNEILLKSGAEVIYTDTTWLTVASALKGKSDAAIGDLGVMSYYAQRYHHDGLHLIRDTGAAKEQLGFGMKKDHLALQNKINAGLKQIRQNGTYQKIYEKWFGQAEKQ